MRDDTFLTWMLFFIIIIFILRTKIFFPFFSLDQIITIYSVCVCVYKSTDKINNNKKTDKKKRDEEKWYYKKELLY